MLVWEPDQGIGSLLDPGAPHTPDDELKLRMLDAPYFYTFHFIKADKLRKGGVSRLFS